MAETEKIRRYTLGMLRGKLLDNLDTKYDAYIYSGRLDELNVCNGIIEAFLATVKDNTEESKHIEKEFTTIDTRRLKELKIVASQIKETWGILEQKDAERLTAEIERDTIQSKKIVCHSVYLKFKLYESDDLDYEL